MMKAVDVRVGKGYNVCIERGLLDRVGEQIGRAHV